MKDKKKIEILIKELIEKTGIAVSEIVVQEDGPSSTWYSVQVNEPHFFLTKEGEALHALNHLVRRMLEVPKTSPTDTDVENNVLVDINGFQKKRVEAVRAVAHMMGERARYFKSSIEVDPMSSFERRIVHEFLANSTDLKTESTGMGPMRRVVIKYVGGL